MLPRILIPTLLILSAAVATLPAQTGPWTDGELLVRSVLPASQTQAIYRIAPETGNGAVLISGFYWGGWAGSMAFDSYRNGMLANMGMPPSIFSWKLWLISYDGTAVSIPGFTGELLRAITPIGDGRVYYQRHQNNATWEVQYLDAANVIHTLMDQTGTAPLSFAAEHMLYHAPSNSLIATSSGWWNTNPCVPTESSVFRIPLSIDGSQVAGPIACASVAGVGNNIMSLDYLPGGDILLTLAGSQYWHETLRRLNPVTLQTSIWAQPGPPDINGGVWSGRRGSAIILDDTANVLRAYGPGQSGNGVEIPSNVPVSPNTSGYSPVETMIEVDTNGPGCIGTSLAYGTGLAGTGTVVPTIGTVGCPDLFTPFTISIDNVVGGAPGYLAVGFAPAVIPAAGGFIYLWPIELLLDISVGGTPNVPGAGNVGLPVYLGDPALAGFNFYLQAAFLDAGAIQGLSLTNGLLLSIG